MKPIEKASNKNNPIQAANLNNGFSFGEYNWISGPANPEGRQPQTKIE